MNLPETGLVVARSDRKPTGVPTLEWPDDAALEAVHDASMRIIEEIGVQLNHERAREIIADHGGSIRENDVVTIPRELVAEALGRAPSRFTLHARNPANDVTVGGTGPPARAPGYGPSMIHTFEDGRRDARLADYERLAKLAQAEDAMTCAGYALCEPTDLPPEDRVLATLERSLTLTDKPVMGPTHGAENATAGLEMVAIAHDDPALSKPSVAGLINTAPPRSIGQSMLEGLLAYADRCQALVISSFTMAGGSGPPTLAASLAQANAETLVGIVLAELVTPGTPVVYGVPLATIDDRYGSLSVASPESALAVSFAGRLARYYGLPSRAGGALSDSKAVGYQSGFESAFTAGVSSLADVDFVLNAAGMLESYAAVSPEKFALDCEIYHALDRFRHGVPVDKDGIALDQIASVDPSGHFVDGDRPDGAPFHRPAVLDKRSHDDWAAAGRKSAFERGQDRVQRLLADYERPPMPDGIARDLDAFVTANTTL
jgi:trimethylamine--corrinoid protein Co-methyltransferase